MSAPHHTSPTRSRQKPLEIIGWTLVFVAIMAVHVWRIADVPNGLFVDETAIGYNAMSIAETGKDEYGVFMPPIFTSFGDAKSPLYIYSAAAMFKVFPSTDTVLRLTSSVFFFFMLLGIWLLSMRLFPNRKEIWLFSLIATGFLPWLFTLSRMSFEVVSQPALLVLSLLAVHWAFSETSDDRQLLRPLVAGLLIGISIHTYPTARLLTPLLLAAVLITYARRSTLQRCTWMIAAFIVAVSPYVLHMLLHPGDVTSRFRYISVFHQPHLSWQLKLDTFVFNYLSHFRLDFLLMNGDPNLRHATGFGGQLFGIVFGLACIGLIAAALRRKQREKFFLLVVALTCLAPVASGLTNEGLPHALRSVLLAPLFILLACYGFETIRAWCNPPMRRIAACVIFIALTVESSLFVYDYFGRYARLSSEHFMSYGLPESVATALQIQPQKIIFSDIIDYTQREWFLHRLTPAQRAAISVEYSEAVPGSCVIFLPEEDERLANAGQPSRDLTLPDAIVHLRCFEAQ